MKTFILSITTIFCILLPTIISARPETFLIKLKNIDLIENTCKTTTNYELCITTLKSDPRSFDATEIDVLGLIIVDAIKSKANSAMETIKKLKISSEDDSEIRVPLLECSIQYNAILNADVAVAIEALTKGDPKFADHGMADAIVEAQGCENSFIGSSNSPLTDVNQAVCDLSGVARSIIRLLL